MHPSQPEGQTSKLLGVSFDLKLHMDLACYEVAAEAGWRLRAVLRCRPFYDLAGMLALYKAQVLSYIEFRTPAIYHAPCFFLQAVDQVQDNFLNELGLTPETALLQHNLSPLQTRRDIAMLGLIFRAAKGTAPTQFERFFHIAPPERVQRGWAYRVDRHALQLQDPIDGTNSRAIKRTVLSLIHICSMLPIHTVESKTVSSAVCNRV